MYKYNFGQTYFYNKLISKASFTKCLYCENGEHKRIGDGEIVKCPVCKGTGQIDAGYGSIKEEPRKCFLRKIQLTKTIDSETVDFQFKDEYDETVFGKIYESIDDAINGQNKCTMGYSKH